MDKLDTYFIMYTIALLTLTMLYTSLSPAARRALGQIGLAAFAGFMVLVALKVMEIVSKR